jgi:hypothetical protein
MNTYLSSLILVVLIVVLIIKDLKVVGMAKVKVE